MREERAASFEPRAGYGLEEVDGVLDRLFGFGVRPLQMEDAVFEAVLAGWRAQQQSRGNKTNTVDAGLRLVRRLCDHAQLWPWQWRALQVEEFVCDWRRRRGRAGRRRFATTSRGSARSWTT